jgi:ABC-2 type transport system ATP-binding protein
VTVSSESRGAAPLVAVHGLTKKFGPTVAVDNLSFEVPRGTVVGFLGPNGAGKTTTLRALLGLVVPDSGTVTIAGRNYRELENPIHQVGVVLEGTAFHPGRTGRNHLRVLATASGIPKSRVEEVLDLVDLRDAANRRVGGYSLGMRQRLALAAALLGDPELLVLDEPANGLDPQGIRWLRDLIRARADAGGTVLVSSHVLAEVAQTVDRVVVIGHGRLLADGTLESLTAGASALVLVASPECARLGAILAQHGARVGEAVDNRMQVGDMPAPRIGELAAEHGIVLHELTPQVPRLEDIFLELTQRAGLGDRGPGASGGDGAGPSTAAVGAGSGAATPPSGSGGAS